MEPNLAPLPKSDCLQSTYAALSPLILYHRYSIKMKHSLEHCPILSSFSTILPKLRKASSATKLTSILTVPFQKEKYPLMCYRLGVWSFLTSATNSASMSQSIQLKLLLTPVKCSGLASIAANVRWPINGLATPDCEKGWEHSHWPPIRVINEALVI